MRHGESPNGALKCDGLDLEAEKRQAEVQTKCKSVVDWSLKRSGSGKKSKRSEEKWRIGL